jgi:putative ferrous iron transport protein C
MLMDIKKLLIEREQVSLTDLARHFYVSESIMLGMLSHWQKKGRVESFDASGACGTGCGSCSESEQSKMYYRWKKVAEKPIFAKLSE